MYYTVDQLNQVFHTLNEEYESMYETDKDYYLLKDSVLKDSQAVQIQLMMRWQNFNRKVSEFLKAAESELDKAFAESLQEIKRTSQIEYSSTEIKNMVMGSDLYTSYKLPYNRLSVLKDKAYDMVKLTEQRHWVLKELVTTMVNDGEVWII